MALPTILVNSATGSDTAASGAGPATAVSGSGATVLTQATSRCAFIGDSVNLSGVSGDGSHVLFINDSTAGARNFAAIVEVISQVVDSGSVDIGVDSDLLTVSGGDVFASGAIVKIVGAGAAGADLIATVSALGSGQYQIDPAASTTVSGATVTQYNQVRVNSSQTLTATGSAKGWAIGGKRSAIGTTLSRKLFETNGTAGDAMPGWIIEMESGHTETISSGIWWRRSGDATDGRMTLKGTYGAASRPKITWTGSTTAILLNGGGFNRHYIATFDVERNITGSAGGVAFNMTGGYITMENLKVTSIGTSNWDGVFYGADTGTIVRNCYGEKCNTGTYQANVFYSYLKTCATAAINITNASGARFVIGNIIYNAAIGIDVNNYSYPKIILNNTIYADTGTPVGVAINANSGGVHYTQCVMNNIINGCTTAFVVDGTSPSAVDACLATGWLFDSNVIYNCTNQITSGYESLLTDTSTANPQFANPATGDFSVGTNMKAIGFPTTVFGFSATRSYNDAGAAQRQEPTGSGGEHSYII